MYMILKEKSIEPMLLIGFREKKLRQSTLDEFGEIESTALPLALLYAVNRPYPLSEVLSPPMLEKRLYKKNVSANNIYFNGRKRRNSLYGTL